MSPRRLLGSSLYLLAGLLASTAASAYTVVFRDESSLVTMEKYQIRGDMALVTLPSGTQTTFPATEIDVEKTAEINRMGVNRGTIIDRPDTKVLVEATATRRETIADLVREHRLGRLGERRQAPREIPRTPAGNVDLFSFERRPPLEESLDLALSAALKQAGQRLFRLFAGTEPDRILVDMTTNNRTEVFAALRGCAAALDSVRESHAGLEALELILSTTARTRAGQFVLTADSASLLRDEAHSPADFFVENVQF